MKQSPEEQETTRRMQPGVYSRDGFLAGDGRTLGQIIEADASAVRQLGASHERIASVLAAAVRKTIAAGGAPVEVGRGLTAEAHEARGKIPCPFGDGLSRKGHVAVTDSRTGTTLLVAPLAVHMIEAHGFYGGAGSAWRIDPAVVCRMFDIGGD